MRSVFVALMIGLLAACGTTTSGTCNTSCRGCCDLAGVCQAGTSMTACGSSGATCRTCSSGATCSTLGVCTTLSSTGGGSASAGGNAGGGSATAGGNAAGGSSAGGTATAGGTAGPCTPGSCTTPNICEPTSRACSLGSICNSTLPQPDVCGYGLVCVTNTCAEAPRTSTNSCANFGTVTTPLAWDPATIATKGSVTTLFAPRATNDDAFCSGTEPNAFTFTVDLYAAPSTNFPTMIDMVQTGTFNYVRTDGQIVDLRASVRPNSGYAMNLTNNNKNVRVVWTACAASTATRLRAGFYALNGNATCAEATR